jgi:hypothetical protein
MCARGVAWRALEPRSLRRGWRPSSSCAMSSGGRNPMRDRIGHSSQPGDRLPTSRRSVAEGAISRRVDAIRRRRLDFNRQCWLTCNHDRNPLLRQMDIHLSRPTAGVPVAYPQGGQ